MNPETQLPAGWGKFWTAANLLSLTRALLSILFLYVMLSTVPPARLWGCIIVAAGALTDKLDGMVARKSGTVTEWGKILDPLADKIGVASIAVVLLLLGDAPLWFVLVLLGRDVLILAGGLFLSWKRGVILPSNEAGKWAVGVISLTLFLMLAGVSSIVTLALMWVCVAMLGFSLFLYARRFMETVR